MTEPPIPPEGPVPPARNRAWVPYVAVGCGCLLLAALVLGILVVMGIVGSIAIPGLERARRQSEALRVQESLAAGGWTAGADTAAHREGQLPPELMDALRGMTGDGDIRGTLESGDRVREDGSFYDEITMDMSSGSGWVVTMRSTDFDAYLTLHAPSGAVYSDDDSGGGRDARVEVGSAIGEPGRWRIWANSYGAGATGEYTLTFEPLR